MSPVSIDEVNRLVLRRQHLTDDSRADSLVEMAWDIGGLHATSAVGPYISAFLRCKDFRKEDLDRELYVNKSLGRLRCMRFTMYVQPTGAFPMYHSAMRSAFQAGLASRLRRTGMTGKEYDGLEKAILEVLKDGGMAAAGIKRSVGASESLFQVLNAMCDEGLLARGPPKGGWKSNLHTYHLFRDYYPDIDLPMDGRSATASLVFLYLKAFGPVTEADIVWWTGLCKSDIREALESLSGRISFVNVSGFDGDLAIDNAGLTALKSACPLEKPAVRLLPSLDPYLMGYKERERYLDPAYYGLVYDRSGNATTCILINGRIAGVWDMDKTSVKIYLFSDVSDDTLAEVRRQAKAMGKFLEDRPMPVERCGSMTPLAQRTAGAVMSPLRSDL